MDAVVRKISGDVGGMHGCVFRNNLYFINTDGVYSINNNNIQKIMDSNLDEGVNDFTKQTLTAFDKYIIINKTYVKNFYNFPLPSIGTENQVDSNLMTLAADNLGPTSNYWNAELYVNGTQTAVTSSTKFELAYTHTMAMVREIFKGQFAQDMKRHYEFKLETNYKIDVDTNEDYTLLFQGILSMNVPAHLGTQTYLNNMGTTATVTITGYDNNDNVVPSSVSYKTSNISTFDPGTDTSYSRSKLKFSSSAPKISILIVIDQPYRNVSGSFVNLFGTNFTFLGKGDYPVGTYFDYTYPDFRYTYNKVSSSWGYTTNRIKTSPYYYYYLGLSSWMPRNELSGNKLRYNTYMLNMDTGSMSVVDYKPYLNIDEDNEKTFSGYIFDVYYNPNVDPITGITSLMLATSDLYDDSDYGYAGKTYVFFTGPVSNDVQDIAIVTEEGIETSRSIKPRYEIEVDAFTPDATEYLVKKFRSFELMGTLPSTDFEISFAYNDNDYGTSIQLIDDKSDLPNSRAHYPHRIGVNQRAQSIGIKMESTNLKDIQDPGIVNSYDFLEISDMEMLWTYTQRDQKYSSYSNKT